MSGLPDKLSVKVIGGGGIGQQLLDPLSRVLNYGSSAYSFEDAELGLIDGDQFEERNRDRQQFRDRGNKAEVTVARLEDDFPNLIFRAHPTYIDEDNIPMLVKEHDIVFLCVDNHNTRKLVSQYCSEELQNVTIISGGNDFHDGNVMVYIRRNGVDESLPIHAAKDANGKRYHPEIANPEDEHPNDVEEREGCLEEAVANPQLLIANNMAAAMMLNAFHGLLVDVFALDGFFRYDEAFFDCRSNKVRVEKR